VSSILERVASGDANAVQQCIERYGGLVYSIARRFGRDAHEIDDAVQETFLQLWRVAPRFEPGRCDEPTFVAMIARRRLIDLKRRADRRGDVHELPEAIESGAQTQVERTEICDDAAKARMALGALKPDQRKVLELAIYDGMSHQEIANETGLPLGTVKTHARRGLERLRELLGFSAAQRASGVTP
jgi:RNA polymerase sigma-70 factor (ECF subfamily)